MDKPREHTHKVGPQQHNERLFSPSFVCVVSVGTFCRHRPEIVRKPRWSCPFRSGSCTFHPHLSCTQEEKVRTRNTICSRKLFSTLTHPTIPVRLACLCVQNESQAGQTSFKGAAVKSIRWCSISDPHHGMCRKPLWTASTKCKRHRTAK